MFATAGVRWWIAGGGAIDLFLGRDTRPHGDLDVACLRHDQPALRTLRDAWEFCVAHDGTLTPWGGEPLDDSRHQFWVRRRGDDAWGLEVLLERERAGAWVYRRDPRISMSMERVGRVGRGGIPYLAPEVTLLYKAKHHALNRNSSDFALAAPALDDEARAWLRRALRIAHPGHPWIARL